MLYRLDAADRLVAAVERQGGLDEKEAARVLLALPGHVAQAALAVVDRTVDDDARLVRRGDRICLAPSPLASTSLVEARFCVVDLETTGLVAGEDRITELAAVVVEAGETVDELEALGPDASSPETLRRLSRLAEGSVLAGHNVRFDLGFLEGVTAATMGSRVAAPVVDTLALAHRLLRGRIERFTLPALADFVGTTATPCHHALPDARAAAELLICLVGDARGRGARTVADLCGLVRPTGHAARSPRSPTE